ncbi:amino acid ABC transporter ATP-binding protein [Paraburkholderia sp. RL17-337-BIB-A]|uniref:amino acid ABC transporter ATP-binding protein n=1 Tax=Paraburkholderia sp. RL17-337-BIB-A TaxID=3031636 RepID=UPI0038B99D2E
MISLQSVSKWYGQHKVLSDCTLNVEKGEVVVVCGPSGSGKSTLIRCVNGLEEIQQGVITVDGCKVTPRHKDLLKLRRKISMVFQSFELYPHKKVIDNLTLAPVVALGKDRSDAEHYARELLERVGMAAFAERWPGNLSGGQQQRVAIARALAGDPIAVLFDEPTSALDPEMINEVLEVMANLAKTSMTMIVVTHEMGFARRVADRIVFMESGVIIEDTPADTFFRQPKSERAARFIEKILSH